MDPQLIDHIEKAQRYISQLELARKLIAQRGQWIELLTEDLLHLDSIEDLPLRAQRKELIKQIQKILDELDV